MKTIKSISEAENSGLAPNVREVARGLVEDLSRIYGDGGDREWEPDEDGHVLVIEESDGPDDPEVVEAVGHPLHEAYLEGVTYEGACYLSCVLWDNDSGLSLLIVDHPGMDPRLRERLEADRVGNEDAHG